MGFRWSLQDRSVGDGFVRMAREQGDKAIAVASDTGEPAARRVHEARRRAKKLRALLRLVRPGFRAYATENAFIRDAARRLSATRDVKVAADTLIDLMAWTGREAPQISVTLEPRDDEQHLARYAADMALMIARSALWKTGKIGLGTLADGLTDTYRRGREAMQHVAVHPTDEGFHEWRKHAKYHWNQLGLIEACAADILPSAHKAVDDLGEQLGLHHDLAMLRDKLTADPTLFGDLDSGFVHDAVARRQRELEAAIAALGRQVYAETPKALHARFSSYLHSWAAEEAVA
jgi:CHAD domain-containing protein